MKLKAAALLCVLSVVFGILGVASFNAVKAADAGWEPTVVGGVMDDRVPLGHVGGNNGVESIYGSKLIEIPEAGENRGWYELQLSGGWGSRYTFDYRVNVCDMEMVLDLSKLNGEASLALILGAGKGNYFNAEYGGFGLKIYYNDTNNINSYGLIVSNVTHNTTISTITPAPSYIPWDSNNTGYAVVAPDRTLKISFKQTSPDVITMTANGNAYAIPVVEFTKILSDNLDEIYLMVGVMSDSTEIIRMTLTDSHTKEYESKLADYVSTVTAYEASANADLSVADDLLDAETAGRAVRLDEMRNYDQAYYRERIVAVENKIAAARAAMSVENLVSVFESDVAELKKNIASAKDNDGLAFVENMTEKITTNDIGGIEKKLNGAVDEKFNAAKAEFENVKSLLEKKRKEVVLAYFDLFKAAIGNVSSAADVLKIEECREAINLNINKLSNKDRSEIAGKLAEYADALEELTAHDGWTDSDGSIVYNDGKTLELLGRSAFNDLSGSRNGSTLTLSEKIKANNFSTEILITAQSMKMFENWIGVSITRKADNFFYATGMKGEDETEKLQSNPGIVMTFEKRAGNKLYVELFMVKVTSQTIYTSTRGQMLIDFKDGDPLRIRIEADDDKNSTYAKAYFNDVLFTGTNIKNSEIKLALGGYEGYLSYSFANPGSSIRINKVNGTNPVGGEEPPVIGPSDSSSSSASSVSDKNSSEKKGCKSSFGGSGATILLSVIAISSMKKRKFDNKNKTTD